MADEVKPQGARRRYRSPVRAEGARRTRQAVVTAASALFEERGFDATSLADVAAAAGVARPTVFAAFGSKARLLEEVLDTALAGDDAPVPVAERPWFRPVWDADHPPQVLHAYADVCVLIAGRAARLFETLRRGSDSSPDVARLWERSVDQRHAGAAMVVDRVRQVGDLRHGLDGNRAGDVLWTLNDTGLYLSLVERRRWPPVEFRAWLADTMCRALLPDQATGHDPHLGHAGRAT